MDAVGQVRRRRRRRADGAGVVELQIGQVQDALSTFSEVIDRKPDFAEGFNQRAMALFMAGDFSKSLADCDEVIKRNPQHFGALAGFGQIYFRQEQYAKAITLLEEGAGDQSEHAHDPAEHQDRRGDDGDQHLQMT